MTRTFRKTLLAACGLTVVGFGLALATPALATDGKGDQHYNKCVTTVHTTVSPFVHLAADETTQTSGTHTLTAKGVRIVTPDATAKVYGYLPLSPEVTLADVKAAGFANTSTSGLLPSYQFGLKINGAWGGTLAWESVYQSAGQTSTADVLHGGQAHWYITKDYAAGSYTKHTVKTWAELVAMLPKDTTATYYGLNQGAGGTGDNTVNDLKLVTKAGCTVHTWCAAASTSPSPSKSASTSPSASASVSASPSASKSPTGGVVTTTTPMTTTTPVANTGSLPVTGPGVGDLAAAGSALVLIGAGGIVMARRKRAAFTAE